MKMALPLTRILFACLFLASSYGFAACSLEKASFEGELAVAKTDSDGFPTVLATPQDELSEILFDCDEGTTATLRILPPSRLKNGGPVLKAKPRSYFDYEGKRYMNGEGVKITGGFENRPVRIGISLGDERYILPASDSYRYEVILQLTIDKTAP